MEGGFHELTWISGRTAPAPGNSHATDLLVINDSGAFLYKPTKQRSKPIEVESEADYGKVLRWYDEGLVQILDERPDVDYMLRVPGAPHATLMGPYQFNMNMPGSTWLIPITDWGWLNSALINTFDFWHMYPIDEGTADDRRGSGSGCAKGCSSSRCRSRRASRRPSRSRRTRPEAWSRTFVSPPRQWGSGPGSSAASIPTCSWARSPRSRAASDLHVEAPNPKAPVATGQTKIFGIEGVKEATYVPSPRFKTAEQLVECWYQEKYGPGGTLHQGEDNYLRKVGSPWKAETTDAIVKHPRTRPADWVREAVVAYIEYCVKTFGQWPVTYNPMQAHFGATVHNVDEEFYDRYYREGYVNDRIRGRSRIWGE